MFYILSYVFRVTLQPHYPPRTTGTGTKNTKTATSTKRTHQENLILNSSHPHPRHRHTRSTARPSLWRPLQCPRCRHRPSPPPARSPIRTRTRWWRRDCSNIRWARENVDREGEYVGRRRECWEGGVGREWERMLSARGGSGNCSKVYRCITKKVSFVIRQEFQNQCSFCDWVYIICQRMPIKIAMVQLRCLSYALLSSLYSC